jgi:hypothetical protein
VVTKQHCDELCINHRNDVRNGIFHFNWFGDCVGHAVADEFGTAMPLAAVP